ncbi:recombinase family protein [Streptomyces tremellae]|uniref:Recombinase family protein n=1 Tax=Streptomyces tremellae TaxID=1124239 RepID=A0ABP7EY61_9ACTN
MKTAKAPTGQRTRAVIYVRISQDRAGSHLGVKRQHEDCEALAERNGWDVVELYVDNDLSAYSGKPRPRYRRMLADLEDGAATVVIAWHTDRLHRSPTELEEYIDISERRGVNTHTCQAGPIDLSTPSGRMTARILGAVARHESEHKGERVARARQQKAEAGQWAGGIRPFGWGVPTGEIVKRTITRVDDETGEEIEEEVEVPVLNMNKAVPEEAAALNEGVDILLGGGSLNSWLKWLTNKGFTTTRGNPITSMEARDMLRRPRNAGISVYRGKEVGRGQWDVIIPEPKFRAVVAILNDPTRRTSPGNKVKYLGSLIYRCGQPGCNETTICTKSGGAKHVGYRCVTRHGGSRRGDKTDEYVIDLIIDRLSKPDAADLLTPTDNGIDVAALQEESEQIRRRLTDTAAAFGAGQITLPQFTEASTVAQTQLESVNKQLARAATKDPLVGLVGAPDVRKAWEALDLPQQRAVLRALLEVTILPARPGRMPDGGYYDYDAIKVEWRRGAQKTPSA